MFIELDDEEKPKITIRENMTGFDKDIVIETEDDNE